MPIARKHKIDLNTTPYYHYISRCVRQAFLCGKSVQTGENYEHRRAWVIARLKILAEIFAIKICAYAVMSNHYHLVLNVDTEIANAWSDEEVIARWKRLFKGAAKNLEFLHTNEDKAMFIAKWRSQLIDISWFMRCLNEHLARKANLEDGCKGRFWEGRYKSQALLDESALLTCMAYVDLNPIRAQLCDNLEESDFTSIQQRLLAHNYNKENQKKPQLMDFKKSINHEQFSNSIPYNEADYILLVRWTGSAVREDKKGFIPTSLSHIFLSHGINEKQWVQSINHFGTSYGWLIGRIDVMKARCAMLNKKWLRGQSASNAFFVNVA